MKKLRDGSFTVKPKFKVGAHESVPSLLIARAKKYPKQVAVEQRTPVGLPQPVTAEELLAQVNDVARGLIGQGIHPDPPAGGTCGKCPYSQRSLH